MTENLTEGPEDQPQWSPEEYEIVDSADVSDEELESEEVSEIDVIELLNFLRVYMLQLNARVVMIEDFLTQFVAEVEKAAGVESEGGDDAEGKGNVIQLPTSS